MKSKVCGIIFLLNFVLGLQAEAQKRIMALGNSITQSNNNYQSYHYPLWKKLVDANVSFDFVGSMNGNYSGNPDWPDYNGKSFDRNHEGHWGWRADEILNGRTGQSKLEDWLQDYTPDIVLLHLGTNDMYQEYKENHMPEDLQQVVSSTLNELQQVVEVIRGKNPQVIVLLAKLIPSSSNLRRKAAIEAFNMEVPALALKPHRPESPVILVDQFSGYDSSQDNYDGTHPDADGEEKMATKWFEALEAVISAPNNQIPEVALTSPSPGVVAGLGDKITIKTIASDSDGSITKVEFFANGSKLGEDFSSPYEFTWTMDQAGDYSITAIATDNQQGVKELDPVKMSVLAGSGKIFRILPLGNSITYDNVRNDTRTAGEKASYRYKLSQLLKQDGYRTDFVGSRSSGYDFFPDANNGGVPGISDDQMVRMLANGFNDRDNKQETPGPYLETYPADIVLLHIGTNGVDENSGDVEKILDEIDKYETNHSAPVTVILAQIINRVPHSSVTSTFNQNIKTMAEARIAKGDNIVIVNMEKDAGLVYSTGSEGDMKDDLHPNVSGNEKMAKVWHGALKKVIDGFLLPVTLGLFTAKAADTEVLLNWETHTESKNSGFYVEHSSDGQEFTSLGSVPSKAGNSTEKLAYSYTHTSYGPGFNYYRLKQVDQNGDFEYSRVVAVKMNLSGVRLQSVFPNPAVNDGLTLLVSSDIISSLLINITDISGKLVQQESTSIISGRNSIQVNLASLSAGTYFINITVPETGKIMRCKIVKS